MEKTSDIKEFIELIKRIENKLVVVTYAKAGLVYLYWSVAIAVYILLSLVLEVIGIVSEYYSGIILIVYWSLMLFIIFYKSAQLTKIINEVVIKVLGKDIGENGSRGRKFNVVVLTGWIIGTLTGWFLIPMFLGLNYMPAGFLLFLGIGNLFIYLAMIIVYRFSINIQLIFSTLLLLSSLLLIVIAGYLEEGILWGIASLVALIIYLLAAVAYLNKTVYSAIT